MKKEFIIFSIIFLLALALLSTLTSAYHSYDYKKVYHTHPQFHTYTKPYYSYSYSYYYNKPLHYTYQYPRTYVYYDYYPYGYQTVTYKGKPYFYSNW